ncbi:Tankyrase-1 [Orbilia brochopaga]|nr:Tankyrase-1 [Drechslerella brochopaga]
MSKDTKAPEEPQHDEGASPAEQLLEACRGNNPELLHEILEGPHCSPEFLNESRNSLGETALHVAAKYGNSYIIDSLLDQEGLEVDPVDVMQSDTPLHVAARYTSQDGEVGADLIHLLTDAGADPRLRNRGGQKPIDLVDPQYPEIREMLRKAEFAMVVQAEIARETATHQGNGDDDDEAGSGPASDSE